MNTEPKSDKPVLNAIYRLDQATKRLPVAQLLSELQIAVERISFSSIHARSPQSTPEFIIELDMLFENEISEDLLQFIHWLASLNALSVLADRTGTLFLNYCIKQYRNVPEVRFITPIELSAENRQYVAQRLDRLYPSPSRVVYEVMPSLVAGFIIHDGSKTVDRSLRSHMTRIIKPELIQDIRRESPHG